MSISSVSVELTRAEALVLFDFVARFTQDERLEIVDQAEQRVLWDICSLLEKTLDEPFMPNYVELLQRAREQVRDDTT